MCKYTIIKKSEIEESIEYLTKQIENSKGVKSKHIDHIKTSIQVMQLYLDQINSGFIF